MDTNINNKIRKIYDLVLRGSTEGERQAAQSALDKMLKKYNLSEEHIKNISKQKYWFPFSRTIDKWLFYQIISVFVSEETQLLLGYSEGAKRSNIIGAQLEYEDWVTVSCAYEYFRPHMHKQYKATVLPELNKCRKQKTRAAKAAELERPFVNRYFIKSGLYKTGQLTSVKMNKNQAQAERLLQDMEGGSFNRQLSNGLLLE